jgi:hypothetical protein
MNHGQGSEHRAPGCGPGHKKQERGAESTDEIASPSARFFPSCPLLLEYQTQHESTPNFIGDIGVEALSYQGQNFSTESKKLDKYCPFGGFGETDAIWPEFS